MPARIAVREIARLNPADAAVVCVAGRVIALDPDGFILQDDTGCVQVRSAQEPRPPIGAFVQLVARSEGALLTQVESLTALTRGVERFMRADSDWNWLSGTRLNNLRVRHQLKRAVQRYFDSAGLLEVETPAIVPCPGLDVHLDAIEVLGMRGPRWLHTSPEYQMKRLLTTSVPGIFQLGKAFRRGERGRLHEPEFSMLEWYRCFANADAVMHDTEQLVAQVAQELTGSLVLPGLQGSVDVTPPWDRLSVAEAFERYADVKLEDVLSDEEAYFQTLADQIEPKLGRGRAVFLTEYPAPMASLAKLSDKNPRVAERFEAYLDGVELCNGFSELTNPSEQRARLVRDQELREKLGRSVYPLDERFLAALEDGIPPSGGNALGFDRLLMLLLGAKHIEDVVAIPSGRV
jgi:elongation factor P--(R)-beta-lysine ligase